MARLNSGTALRRNTTSAVRGGTRQAYPTHQGGAGYARDTKGELFTLAVSLMSGESSYYETTGGRDDRYARLVQQTTRDDPEWTAALLGWLRTAAHVRTASIAGAVEFVAARLADGAHGMSRQVVDSVLQRADEPGELIAAWQARHGRALPKPVKRGVSDAVWRLYTERAFARWDSPSRPVRFGDVIELVHPTGSLADTASKPVRGTWRGELYQHVLDVRHGRVAERGIPESLGLLRARAELMRLPLANRRALILIHPDAAGKLRAAGMPWEAVAGWVQSAMDADVWRAIIPSMGYMALLRNLRNFDRAGLDDDTAAQICARLADPDAVAASRQLPFRFVAAYRAAPSLRWGHALDTALRHSLGNVPRLAGRTLVLVDRSGSMFGAPFSRSSTMTPADTAALFGAALALSAETADLVQFGTTSARVRYQRGDSLLRIVDRFAMLGGTDTQGAIASWLRPGYHDRVVIVTDEQTGYRGDALADVPPETPVYTWNLAGYEAGHGPSGGNNRHSLGGLSDNAFRVIPLLESCRSGGWPWEVEAAQA